MNKINVTGLTDFFEFNSKRIIKKVVKETFKELNIKSKHEINFLLTDSETIHSYNFKYRNIDRPTDVISFAYIDSTSDRSLPYELGDIIICTSKVLDQANEFGHSILREFAFLVTHGMLHLLGYDHMTEVDEKEMFGLQDRILEKIKITRN